MANEVFKRDNKPSDFNYFYHGLPQTSHTSKKLLGLSITTLQNIIGQHKWINLKGNRGGRRSEVFLKTLVHSSFLLSPLFY